VGTWLEDGKLPIKFMPDGKQVEKFNSRRETKYFDGEKFLLETSLTADYAFVKCQKADKYGNLQFRKTTRNFNPVIARAARITIAEAEEIVEEIDPENVHLPGVYV
jgi:acyl CoA:acetate/3-ketoacid CoA transferase alpha subunit